MPNTINYQAYITHSADTSALDTVADFTFRIYDSPTGGNLLWSENQSNLQVIRGILDTRLGVKTPLPPTIFYTGQTLWLEVVMGAETFSPRKALVSVGQAFHAQRSDTADVALNIPPAPDTVLFAWHSDTGKYSLEGYRSLYSDTAEYARNVPGPGNYIQNQHASAQTPGAFWISDSATVGDPSGKYARLNSGNYAVYGRYNASTYAYFGDAAGRGVYGHGTTGVEGEGQPYGIVGRYDANRFGYIGSASYGVYGRYDASNYGHLGSNGVGAFGRGTDVGIFGYVYTSDADTGVKGVATGGGTDIGVYGSSSGYGVYGYSASGIAIYGCTTTSTDTVMILEGPTPGDAEFRFMTNGNAYADGSWTGGEADFAEMVTGEKGDYEPRDVLVISDEIDRAVEKSSEPYSTKVMGVVSTQPGFVGGSGDEPKGDVPVAVVGIVTCKVSGEGGPIKKGDLLTTSSTPGHAMKASPFDLGGVEIYRPGTILGKAMEDFSGERGTILIYVNVK